MRQKSRAKYYFLLPGVIWVLVFTIFPLVYALAISFTNARLATGNRPTEFIGLQNYLYILTDHPDDRQNIGFNVQERLVTTLFYCVASVFLCLTIGTFMAWLFNRDLPGLKRMRAVLTMPLFAAPIALGYLGVIIFNEQNGPINNIITGVGGVPIQWIVNPWGARFAVLITDVWQWTPFVFIVILAAMQSIPEELTEAAHLDTSSSWTIFRRITLPFIAPALGTVGLLKFAETLKIFDIPFTLTGGGPGSATQSYNYYVYLTGLNDRQYGAAAAMAWILVIFASIIAAFYFRRMRARYE
jgi:multiple sugar transport system permease protein